jgi:deazaflavin-dependent oxidoreductase (nitroreductase family)
MDQETAAERSREVGMGSIAIGVVLMLRPGIAKVAGLGAPDARVVALADLAVGTGLIAGRPRRRPWVLARAGANVGIAAVLMRRGSRAGRMIAAGLGAATIADLQMARALPDEGEGAARTAYGRFNLLAAEAMNRRGVYLGRRATKVHVAMYRRTGGKAGGAVPGWPDARIALVRHRGARTGTARTSPLMFHADGEVVAVVASKGGMPTNPAWFHNLMANLETEVQIGPEVRPVRARLATEAERDRLWPEFEAFYPGYAAFRERARPRTIPIVLLEPR